MMTSIKLFQGFKQECSKSLFFHIYIEQDLKKWYTECLEVGIQINENTTLLPLRTPPDDICRTKMNILKINTRKIEQMCVSTET